MGVISGFFSLNDLKEDRREEQYDSILITIQYRNMRYCIFRKKTYIM